ncbi:MAG: hypothetical protein ACKORB_04890 [Opitutia bacterium]
MSAPGSIGFPAGTLAETAIRIAVLARGEGWVALGKPGEVCFEDHPWQEGRPTLLGSLRAQLAAGKPEMLRLGLRDPAAVFGPEPEVDGVAIVAERDGPAAAWREAVGSGAFTFSYEFIARAEDAPEDGGLCDLPLAMDDAGRKAFVSHRNGKRAETRFAAGETAGRWRVWTARTFLPRRDQIRVHASECGLRIAGELRYGRSGRVTLTDTTPRGRLNKGEDRPMHRGLLLRLAEVRGKVGGAEVAVSAPAPDDFAAVLKRLGRAR